jgi:hypothetical protein
VGGSFDMCVGFDERWVCLLKERWVLVFEERGVCSLNSITEGTYKTKHTEALGSTILRHILRHINTGTTDTHESSSSDTLVDVIAPPIVEGNA